MEIHEKMRFLDRLFSITAINHSKTENTEIAELIPKAVQNKCFIKKYSKS
jgi:hypothetical protein